MISTTSDILQQARRLFEFKALLARRGAIDRWPRFEDEATKEALRAWCRDNEIEITG